MDEDWYTPLMAAALFGHVAVVADLPGPPATLAKSKSRGAVIASVETT
jgi:hypothetical protein